MIFRLSLLLAILLATMLPGRPAAAEDKVRIGQATAALAFLPIWAARATNGFEAQNLQLEWAALPGGDPATLAALDAGDIDLAAVGSTTALQAIAKGQPFQLVYNLMDKVTLELSVSNAFLERTRISPAAPLKERIAALKGGLIGVSAIGGEQDRTARWLAGAGGLDPKTDIKVALVGSPIALEAALENGRIDAFVLSPPEGFLIEHATGGKVLVRLGDEFPELRALPYLVLVARKDRNSHADDLAVRTAKVLQTAGKATIADSAPVSDMIAKRFFAKAEPGAVAAAVDAMKNGMAGNGRFSEAQMRNLLAFATETSATAGTLPGPEEGTLWSNAIVDKAAAR